jgi:stage IV sporulation protein FB
VERHDQFLTEETFPEGHPNLIRSTLSGARAGRYAAEHQIGHGERLRPGTARPILAVMMQGGYWHLGRWRGVPLRMHFLAPVGALFFSGFRFEPGVWAGFLLLVLLHEIGHALWVMRYGLRVASIDLHAYGGACRWSGQATDWQRTIIAWGGVMAQAVLLALTAGVVSVAGLPRSGLVRQLVDVFIGTNLWLMLINLAPFPPLDGADAWKIIGELRRRWGSPTTIGTRAPPAARGNEKDRVSPQAKASPEEARRIAKALEDAVRRWR